MVDSVRNVQSVSCSVGWKCVYDVKGRIREHASSHSLCIDGIVLSGTKITFSVNPVKRRVQYDY